MRGVSEAMRAATNDLRRQDSSQAAASASRALERLRELERRMQAGRPDERRRAIGEMQLEARQLADAQRQVAAELGRAGSGDAGKDTVRRLAGEQDRLAERARRLQDAMKRQAGGGDGKEAAKEATKEMDGQQVAERMQRSADAMRTAAERTAGTQRGSTAPPATSPGVDEARAQVGAQQEIARSLDRTADRLAATGSGPGDSEAGKLSNRLTQAQELQERIDRLTDQMKRLGSGSGQNQSGGRGGESNASRGRGEGGQGTAAGQTASRTPGDSGRPGEGQAGGGGSGSEASRLREEAQRAMRETRDLLEQMRREDPTFSGGGPGITFEGQGMTTTAPGTEGFKQDFAKWDDLRRQATLALEAAQSSLVKKLQAKAAKERLAAGADDKAPPEYQKQVDDYFKAIAAKKKGG